MNGFSKIVTRQMLNYFSGWMGLIDSKEHTNPYYLDRQGGGLFYLRLSSAICGSGGEGWRELDRRGTYKAVLMNRLVTEGVITYYNRGLETNVFSSVGWPAIAMFNIYDLLFGPQRVVQEWPNIHQIGIWTGQPTGTPGELEPGDTTTLWERFVWGKEVYIQSASLSTEEQLEFPALDGIKLAYAVPKRNTQEIDLGFRGERGIISHQISFGNLEESVVEKSDRCSHYNMASMLTRNYAANTRWKTGKAYQDLGDYTRNRSHSDVFYFPTHKAPNYLRLTLHHEEFPLQGSFGTKTPDLDYVWAGASFGVVSNNNLGPYKYFWEIELKDGSPYAIMKSVAYITWMDFYFFPFPSKPSSLGIAWYLWDYRYPATPLSGEIGTILLDTYAEFYVDLFDIPITLPGDISVQLFTGV